MLWYLEDCGNWTYTWGEDGAPIFPHSWLEMHFFHRLFLETPECRKAILISEGLVTCCSKPSSRQLWASREHSASVKSHTKSPSLAATRSGVSDSCDTRVVDRGPSKCQHCASEKSDCHLPAPAAPVALHRHCHARPFAVRSHPPFEPPFSPPPSCLPTTPATTLLVGPATQAVYLSRNSEWSLYTATSGFAQTGPPALSAVPSPNPFPCI